MSGLSLSASMMESESYPLITVVRQDSDKEHTISRNTGANKLVDFTNR